MKYKVGDIVKLRDDLEVGKKYGGAKVGGSLALAIGKKGEIKGILTGQYHIKFSSKHGGYHFVSDEMIEGLWEESKSTEQVSKSESKYKLIDILNKIANGELKEGTKVKYACFELIYDNEMLINDKGDLYAVILRDMAELNAEVELIEPKHLPDVGKMSEPTDNTKIEKLVVDETDINCLGIHSKTILLNIIDRLNKVINKVNIHSTVLLAQEKDIEEIKNQLYY